MDDDDQYWRRNMERAVRDPTQLSTSFSQPVRSLPPNPPARIKAMIAELGLRYRPPVATDLHAHAAALALLTQDVADMPPDRLERAIRLWFRKERWMPKASELVALCAAEQQTELNKQHRPPSDAGTWVEQRNARLATDPKARRDIEWFVDDAGDARLRIVR